MEAVRCPTWRYRASVAPTLISVTPRLCIRPRLPPGSCGCHERRSLGVTEMGCPRRRRRRRRSAGARRSVPRSARSTRPSITPSPPSPPTPGGGASNAPVTSRRGRHCTIDASCCSVSPAARRSTARWSRSRRAPSSAPKTVPPSWGRRPRSTPSTRAGRWSASGLGPSGRRCSSARRSRWAAPAPSASCTPPSTGSASASPATSSQTGASRCGPRGCTPPHGSGTLSSRTSCAAISVSAWAGRSSLARSPGTSRAGPRSRRQVGPCGTRAYPRRTLEVGRPSSTCGCRSSVRCSRSCASSPAGPAGGAPWSRTCRPRSARCASPTRSRSSTARMAGPGCKRCTRSTGWPPRACRGSPSCWRRARWPPRRRSRRAPTSLRTRCAA